MGAIQAAGDTIRVLHVDDEPDFGELVATFVERTDDRFAFETATSASEGLDRLASADFDCVVSDYDMPGRNGIEFLERVREEYPDLPFILYTGKGSEEVASEAISAGVTDYLQKESGTSQYAVLANRIRNAVEQYYARTKLADREQRLNLFFEQSPLGVIEWDENFRFARMNDAAESILGYSTDELSGRAWETIVPESDRDAVADVVSSLLENEGGHHIVNENVRKDGERIVCEWHNRVVTDDDGDVVAIFSQFEDVTEQTERERELERYEAYLQGSTDVITVLDESGTIQYESPSVERVLGYDPEELLGTNGFELIHPDDVDAVYETFTDLVSEPGATVTVECRFRTADDQWRWLEVRGTNRLENDIVDGVVTNNRDITERKEVERKREQIISRVTDAIVEVNADWEFTLVNEQAAALYDMDGESLLGRDFWDVFAGALGTRFEDEYRRVMAAREPTSFTEYYDGLDGWFDVEAYPKDDGGIAFYFTEVTEQRRRQRELERQDERFRYVETVADIGYWEIDTRTPEPHEVHLSDGVYRIHGLSPDEEFDVERGLEFYHPEDRPAVRAAVESAIADGEPYDLEARLVTADGTERWVHSVGEPVERDGAVVKVRGVFQDVTDRKRRQRELARRNERLDQFASVVSHDLRNPLNVAEGSIELARAECSSDHLEDAADAVERCLQLVDRLLTIEREGSALQEMEPVDVGEVAADCWQNVATAAASLVTATERPILADRGRLQQLLANLVRNAVEHGGDDVTVTVGETDGGFYVADDGPGIPASERDRIFEAGQTTAAGGTGLGLVIVEQVALEHGWDVRVTESEDGGARFEVTGVEPA